MVRLIIVKQMQARFEMLSKIENWLPIEGYEGLYEVSDLGRIKRLSYSQVMPSNGVTVNFNERILKQSRHNSKRIKNYYQVTVSLCKNSKPKTYIVSRLVANAFIKNVYNKKEVHHIDHNTSNNEAKNLEWVDRKEQFDEHHFQQQSKSRKGIPSKNRLKVEIGGIIYQSMNEACIANGWNKGAIANARFRGRDKIHGKEFHVINESSYY